MSGNWIAVTMLDELASGYFVTSLLTAHHCLVRPFRGRPGAGMDLHCEMKGGTGLGNAGILHFWVQVKNDSAVRLLDDETKASYPFSISDLDYWSRQPIPVFAFLVPPIENPSRPSVLYVVDVTQRVRATKIPGDQETLILDSDFRLAPGADGDLQDFLRDVVPQAALFIETRRSVESLTPRLHDAYVMQFTAGDGERHWLEACEEIRRTAARTLPELIEALRECPAEAGRDFIKALRTRLAPLLQIYARAGDQHWETHYALSVDALEHGDFEEALAGLERAESFISIDDKFRREYADAALIMDDIRRRTETCKKALRLGQGEDGSNRAEPVSSREE